MLTSVGRNAVARQHALDLGRQLGRMRGERSRADQRKSSRSHGGGFCLNDTRRTSAHHTVRRRTAGMLR